MPMHDSRFSCTNMAQPVLHNVAQLVLISHCGLLCAQGMARSGKTAVVAAPLALEKEQVSVLLPPGCSLEYVVPVQVSYQEG